MKSELRQRLVRFGPFLGLLLVVAFFAIASGAPERYLSTNNLRVVLAQTVIVALGAIGMTLIIVGGGIDLAVGSTIALTGVLCALAIREGWAPIVAVLASVLAGGAVGLLNGLAVTRLRVVPFVIVLLVGCHMVGDDPNKPLFVVYVLSPPGGTFTVTHRNELGAGGGPTDRNGVPTIFQGTGNFQEVMWLAHRGYLDTSLQEIRGSFTGAYFAVGFGTFGMGLGAESGSLQSLSGPDPQLSPCSVRYGASEAGGSSYRVQFRFTADGSRVCREP